MLFKGKEMTAVSDKDSPQCNIHVTRHGSHQVCQHQHVTWHAS